MAFPVSRVAGGHVGDHVAGWWSTGGGGRELGRSAAGRDPAGQLHSPKGRQQQGILSGATIDLQSALCCQTQLVTCPV